MVCLLQTVLNVERNVIAWFEVLDETTCRKEQFPVCLIEGEKAHWYLFPVFEQPGLKIGLFDHLKERVDKPEKMRRAISKMDEKVSSSLPPPSLVPTIQGIG